MQTIKNLKFILILTAIVGVLMLVKVAQERRWPGNAGEAAERISQRTAFISADELQSGEGRVALIQLGDSKTGAFLPANELIKATFDNLESKEMRMKLKQPGTRFVIVADSADQAVSAWVILNQLGVENLYVLENREAGGELFKYQFRPDTTFRPEPVDAEE